MSKTAPLMQSLKRFAAVFLLLAVLMGTLFLPSTVSAATKEESLASRLINLVYDDSNSMVMNYNTAWSEAKYSMEILSAMMQEKDVMNIYFMSEYDSLRSEISQVKNLSGKSSDKQSNINSIHNAVSNTGGTYFAAIEAAYNDLKNKGGSYDERHLVVLTDGNSFSDGANAETLDKLFGNAKNDNIKVIYLAIADPRGTKTIKPTENDTVFVAEATPDTTEYENSILCKVTEICERIFQRPAHDVGENAIDLKVPVSEIVIFAQGSNVSIGDIKGAKKNTNSAALSASDIDKASLHPDNSQIKNQVKVAEGLAGMVATFTPASGEYLAEGKYDIKVSATSYTVYYKPCLDVKLDIKDSSGNQVNNNDTVNIGNYTAEYFLTYPKGHEKYGEKIGLAGLGINPTYTLTVTTDGTPTEYTGDSPKTIELKAGDTEVKVTAKYLTYISTDQSVNLVVEDMQEYPLTVEIQPEKKDYIASELEKETEGYKVQISMPDGSAITSEQWNACEIKLNSDGIEFYDAVKNSDFSFTVRPKLLNGNYKDTKTGEIPFKATVTIRDEKQRRLYKGNDDGIVNLYNDVVPNKNGFKVQIDDINPDKIKSTGFGTPSAKVTISWNGNPLTKAQYEALQLTAKMKKDYKVKDASGNEVSLIEIASVQLDSWEEGKPTTATLTFKSAGSAEAQRTKLHKYDGFKVTAVIDREGVKNETSDSDDLGVKRVWTFIEILILLLIIALILSYLPPFKRYLPWKITYRCRGFGNKMNPEHHYTYLSIKGLLSLLVPILCIRTNMEIDCYKGKVPIPVSLELVACRKLNGFFPKIGSSVKAKVLNKESLTGMNQSIDSPKAKLSEDIIDTHGSKVFDSGRVMVEFTPGE